jgi:hypothetical protein
MCHFSYEESISFREVIKQINPGEIDMMGRFLGFYNF